MSQKSQQLLNTEWSQSGAEFSRGKLWRYALWREWARPTLDTTIAFIGLNPSTADATTNDPTVTRCINFAKQWGFARMLMLNAYALRSTDPKGLWQAADPIGPDNDAALKRYASQAALHVVCWGVNCRSDRERAVLEVLSRPVYCLGTTSFGRPKHPLYLKNETQLERFQSAR